MFKPYSKNKLRHFSQFRVATHPEQINSYGAFERLEELVLQHDKGGDASDLERQIQQQLAIISALKNPSRDF